MKGVYCLVLEIPEDVRVRVGAIGVCGFPAGVYVYVGSAMSGIEQRLARHVRKVKKKKKWHIDYLLAKGEVLSTVAVPSQTRDAECAIARSLSKSECARVVVKGFGSSDCGCEAHLFHFGVEDPAWVTEILAKTVAMLSCVYPSHAGAGRE